jgi:hypothetical protein
VLEVEYIYFRISDARKVQLKELKLHQKKTPIDFDAKRCAGALGLLCSVAKILQVSASPQLRLECTPCFSMHLNVY